MANGDKNGGLYIPRWAIWLAGLLLLPGVGVVVRQEIRLAQIESNRHTSADQAAHQELENSRYLRILEMLATKADRSAVPPPEVTQALAEIRRRLNTIEAQMGREDGR